MLLEEEITRHTGMDLRHELIRLRLNPVFRPYGKFTNMEGPLPEGSSNTLIIRFLWVTNALIFFP